jgi:hypothetical protein
MHKIALLACPGTSLVSNLSFPTITRNVYGGWFHMFRTLKQVLRWVDGSVNMLATQYGMDADVWQYIETDGMPVGENL